MSSSVLTAPTVGDADQRAHTRLIVTRRDPATRRYHAIGFLDRVTDGYEFTYLASAITAPGFVPLVGFSDVNHRYHRRHLFPSFAERVISALITWHACTCNQTPARGKSCRPPVATGKATRSN
jgi:hypothetical protein